MYQDYSHHFQNDWFKPLALAVAVLFSIVSPPAMAARNLAFLTWFDYIDPEVVAEFEQKHDVKINFTYYESDDARDGILADSTGTGYDLAIVNGVSLNSYTKLNWIAPLSEDDIPNLALIEPRWRSAFPSSESYAVPYFWGTLGIAYRKDLVPEGFDSWTDFFQPAEKLRGKISMLRNVRDVFGMALKSLGYSVNTNDRAAIREAGRLLERQLPFVLSYSYPSAGSDSSLITGDVWASLAYNGDTLMLQEQHDQIAYVVPKEGGNLWADYLVIMQSSQNKELSAQFIDFLNQPKIAARNAEFVYFATPNSRAHAFVSAEYSADPAIYPSAEILERSEPYQELAPRTLKTVNGLFIQLTN